MLSAVLMQDILNDKIREIQQNNSTDLNTWCRKQYFNCYIFISQILSIFLPIFLFVNFEKTEVFGISSGYIIFTENIELLNIFLFFVCQLYRKYQERV